jgi:hypothetical protein
MNKKDLKKYHKKYNENYEKKNKKTIKKRKQKYYIEHKKQIDKRNKKWHKNHRKQHLTRTKKWYKENKDRHAKTQKKWNSMHIKEQIEYRKEYHKENKEKYLVSNYANKDKKKGLSCNLTENWLKKNITSKPCFYCGDTENIGCDRIDNSKGHIKINVVPCCPQCNMARGNFFTTEEMLLIGATIKIIKAHRKKFK